MASENHHGYRWSDGTVHDVPEPARNEVVQRVEAHVLAERAVPHVTQATLDKAYADWLKEYTRWKAAFAEWEVKYGKR